MEPKEQGKSWYRPALIFYAKTTSWIVGPIAIAFLVRHFMHVSATLFFIILGACFVLTIWGIYKEIKLYRKEFEEGNDKK